VWLDFYGWSWVGCESWGWAPYHYGRWYHASFGWAWWPGPAYGPYYWRPALVGFFGWGGGVGFGVGFGFGNLGWVALGPGEFFRPWYGRGFYGGFRGAGVVNVNAMAAFRNARYTNAVSSMRAGDFGRAGVSSANMVRPGAADLVRAGAVHGQLPVTPSRESTQFSNRAASTEGMPRTSENTRFASHMQTSQSNRMSFDQQQRGMSQGMSQGMSRAAGAGSQAVRINPQIVQNRGAGGAGSTATGARSGVGPGSSAGSSGGWQRFDPSANRGTGSLQPSGGMRQGTPQSSGQLNGGYRGGQSGSQSGSQQASPAGRGYSQPNYSQPRGGSSGSSPQPSNSGNSRPSNSGGGSRPSGGGGRGSGGGKGRR
jgi:hypothetical protein